MAAFEVLVSLFLVLAPGAMSNSPGRTTCIVAPQVLPDSLASLEEWYSGLPLQHSATELLAPAFAHFDCANEMSALLPIVGEGPLPLHVQALRDEELEEASWYLKRNTEALALLGTGIRHGWYAWPLPETLAALPQGLPLLSETRQGVRLLALRAVWEEAQGLHTKATASLVLMFRLANAPRSHPFMQGQLTRLACLEQSTRFLGWVLHSAPLDNNQLLSIQRVLDECDAPCSVALGYVGEYSYAYELSGSRDRLSSAWNQLRSVRTDLPPLEEFLAALPSERERIGRFTRRVLDVGVTLPLSSRWAALRGDLSSDGAWQSEGRCILGDITGLTLTLPLEKELGVLARIRAARAWVAVARYANTYGALPPTLSSLVPHYLVEVPIDPFDGRPIRYKRGDRTKWSCYSVGPDLHDDGGIENATTWSMPDVVF